jgi:hypothetical protein
MERAMDLGAADFDFSAVVATILGEQARMTMQTKPDRRTSRRSHCPFG